MVEASISGEGNRLSNTNSLKRRRSSGDGAKTVDTTRSAIVDLHILDCPICYEALSTPIFQCVNGHLAWSTCCPKLRNKCRQCALPIGHSRCRSMENVVESIFFPCPNAKFGCTQSETHGKESTHEKECIFSQCSCPVQDCNYTGSYKNLFYHNTTKHRTGIHDNFSCGNAFRVQMNINDNIWIKRELSKELLFVVQCFREPYGVYVTVSCIAPSAPELGAFSYRLSYSVDGHTVMYTSPELKRIQRVSFEIPEENCMLIPHKLLRGESLDMNLSINKVQEKKKQKLDRDLSTQCSTLLRLLMVHQAGFMLFNEPVDPVKLNIPDYFSVISKPMDLGTIKSKLLRNEYSSLEEFAADVRLTFINAMTYSPPNNQVHKMAKELKEIFEVRWESFKKKLSGIEVTEGSKGKPLEVDCSRQAPGLRRP